MTFLAFRLVAVNTFQGFYLIVTRVLVQTQRQVMKSY